MNDHLDAIRRDLPLVIERARWAFGLMWEKPGRGLDAERGAVHRPPTPEEAYERQVDPDFIAGPVHDIEHGNHRARVAYRAAVKAVGTADRRLAGMLLAEGTRFQPWLVALDPYADPLALAQAVRSASWRAEHLQHPERHTRGLAHVRTELDRAVRGFSPVLDQGSAGDIAHAEDAQPERGIPKKDRCRICNLRKAAKKKAGRCNTCGKWFDRTGEERPKHLDGINPHDAQAKRLARNEGWGAA